MRLESIQTRPVRRPRILSVSSFKGELFTPVQRNWMGRSFSVPKRPKTSELAKTDAPGFDSRSGSGRRYIKLTSDLTSSTENTSRGNPMLPNAPSKELLSSFEVTKIQICSVVKKLLKRDL